MGLVVQTIAVGEIQDCFWSTTDSAQTASTASVPMMPNGERE